MRQKPGRPGGVVTGEGEARAGAATDEAELARSAQTSRGADDLLMRALARENLLAAWKRVKANKGSAGVDGRTVQDTAAYLKQVWPAIRERLLDGTYRPEPVRRVGIPKPGGGVRELGIPTVVDRLIQQALLQVLQPLIDPTFSAHSYGFRPGRSAHDAVLAAQAYVQAGRHWVVDVDLEKFFDRVNHDILMDRLARRIADRRVLRLIRRYLQAGILAHGVSIERYEGTPQGGPLARCWPTCCWTGWIGSCSAGALLRALCRRLQRLRGKPPGGRAGAASAARLLCEAATAGQRSQDGRGGGLGTQVPGLLLLAT